MNNADSFIGMYTFSSPITKFVEFMSLFLTDIRAHEDKRVRNVNTLNVFTNVITCPQCDRYMCSVMSTCPRAPVVYWIADLSQWFIGLISYHIKLMSHEQHRASNNRKRNLLFKSVFRLTTKTISKPSVTGPSWEDSPLDSSHSGPVTRNVFLCHGVLWF